MIPSEKILTSKLWDTPLPSISDFFTLRDFSSPDSTSNVLNLKIHWRIIEIVNEIRYFYVCRISSGYRTPEHNKKIGGAEKSYRIKGLAIDIVPVFYCNVVNLFEFADKIKDIGGLGIYVDHVHIDLREGQRLYWVKIPNEKYKYFRNKEKALNYFKTKISA